MSRGRGVGNSSAVPASLPEDDDMLWEILLRLPPQPSSLPRASAVCRRWRRLVTDPKFHRQFRVHHRKPPLLGVFSWRSKRGILFNAILDPPDRIPPMRFSLGRCGSRDYDLLDCRHGLVLVKDWLQTEVVVCDPITSRQRRVSVPPEFKGGFLSGAVLCAAGDLGHVHGGCHSSLFRVVLVVYSEDNKFLARVYSSESSVWGNIISTATPATLCELSGVSATLACNALHWMSEGDQILEFDLDEQSLAVITGPPVANDILSGNHQIIQGEDGGIGFAILCFPRLQMWQMKVNCHGVATWVPWRTIEMHTIFGLHSPVERLWGRLLGHDEENGIVFVCLKDGVYMVQLMSMQSRKLYDTHNVDYYPFTSFFTPETNVGGEHEAGLLHNT